MMKIALLAIVIIIPILDWVIAKGDKLFDCEEDIEDE